MRTRTFIWAFLLCYTYVFVSQLDAAAVGKGAVGSGGRGVKGTFLFHN